MKIKVTINQKCQKAFTDLTETRTNWIIDPAKYSKLKSRP